MGTLTSAQLDALDLVGVPGESVGEDDFDEDGTVTVTTPQGATATITRYGDLDVDGDLTISPNAKRGPTVMRNSSITIHGNVSF